MSVKKSCITDTSWRQQDYRIYRFSKKERLRYGMEGFLLGSLLLYFFYQTLLVLLPGIFCGILYCGQKKKLLAEEKRNRLEQQFKDWLELAASDMQAGYSVENAFVKAGRQMTLLYGKDADIHREMRSMEHLLENHITLEKILWDLGERSGLENIRNFAEVFGAGKRSGGNLREMIENSCGIIVMKTDVEKEIRTLLHGKIMEQKIMCLVPFGIIAYISISSPGYFSPLYHNGAGVGIMTGCLCFYLFAAGLASRIVRKGAAV